MPATSESRRPDAASTDGFAVLDACHRQTLAMLDQLATLLSRLDSVGADATAMNSAAAIVKFFASTARQHHEDEERHVFPKLATTGDPHVVQAVLRLQQDHDWLEEDWMELSPQLDAIACGQTWFDIDVLKEGAAVFSALSADHIALEEALIYPEARARLGTVERREMGREMAARRRAARAGRA